MHCVFSFRCPMNIGFDGAKDTDVVVANDAAGVDPVRLIII